MAYGACDAPTGGFAPRITYVIGPDGKVLQVHPQVSAKTHPTELLKTL